MILFNGLISGKEGRGRCDKTRLDACVELKWQFEIAVESCIDRPLPLTPGDFQHYEGEAIRIDAPLHYRLPLRTK